MKLKIEPKKNIHIQLIISWIFLACLLQTCSKKAPQIDYLPPNDRENEYFLDKDTFQLIEKAYFAPPEKIAEWKLDKQNKIQYPLTDAIDTEKLIQIFKENNKFFAEFRYENKIYYTFHDIISLQFSSINSETLLKPSADKKQQDANRGILEKLKIRELLQKNACKQAQLRLIFRLINLTAHGQLEADSIINDQAPPVYHRVTEKLLTDQINILNKLKINYEIIEESFADADPMQCKIVAHWKKKNLIFDYKKLIAVKK